MEKLLRIGQLAKRCGLSPWTIRYYERIGLLPKAPRSTSRYRLYTEDDVERLGFIQRAKQLGLPLARIRALLPLTVGSCEHLRPRLKALIEEQLGELDQRLAELTRFRTELAASLTLLETSCRPIRGEACRCSEAEATAVIPASQIRSPHRAGRGGRKNLLDFRADSKGYHLCRDPGKGGIRHELWDRGVRLRLRRPSPSSDSLEGEGG